jgi:hypothetical protein
MAWQAIRASLAAVGVDLDAAMTDLEMPNNAPARERPLQDALQGLAWYFAVLRTGVMPLWTRARKQRVDRLRRELTTLTEALAILDEAKGEGYLGVTDELRAAAHGTLHAELTDLIARLHARLDMLTMPSRSSTNARKMHVEYWRELTRLWLALTANAERRRHKDLLQFLFGCSAPLFPKATTDKALTAFIERHSPANG